MGAKNRQDVLDPTTDTRTNVKKMNKEAVSWLMTIRVRYMTASFQADVTHHKVCVCVLYSLVSDRLIDSNNFAMWSSLAEGFCDMNIARNKFNNTYIYIYICTHYIHDMFLCLWIVLESTPKLAMVVISDQWSWLWFTVHQRSFHKECTLQHMQTMSHFVAKSFLMLVSLFVGRFRLSLMCCPERVLIQCCNPLEFRSTSSRRS